MIDTAKLRAKPCPFCGSSAVIVETGTSFRWRVAVCDKCDARSGEVRIQTHGKNASEWEAQAESDALAEWDKRSGPQGATITEVWVIAQKAHRVYGHGDNGTGWNLPTTDVYDSGPFHPAFTTEAAALAYLETQSEFMRVMLAAVKLEIRL